MDWRWRRRRRGRRRRRRRGRGRGRRGPPAGVPCSGCELAVSELVVRERDVVMASVGF